jgi:hypothetical protein
LEKKSIRSKAHYVYDDIEEFREHHPNIVVKPDWRNADEEDWVYSDDGRIVQLLKVSKSVKHPGDRKNYKYAKGWVRTIVGSFLNRPNIKMGAVDAYKKAYTEMSNDKARKKATILLKQERVMKEIEKSVLDVAKGLGIDHEYILGKLKNLADYSEDDNIILQSAKELGKIVGTSGTTVKQREVGLLGVFQGFSPDEIEGAAREQKQITAQSESE